MGKFQFLKSLFILMLLSTAMFGSSVKMIKPSDLKDLKDDFYVIDIRSEKAVKKTGKIEDSILISLKNKGYKYDIELFVKELTDKVSGFDTPIILVDKTGKKSTFLAKHILKNTKYSNLTVLSGGIKEWKLNNFELEEVLVY